MHTKKGLKIAINYLILIYAYKNLNYNLKNTTCNLVFQNLINKLLYLKIKSKHIKLNVKNLVRLQQKDNLFITKTSLGKTVYKIKFLT